jgi:hypothetical protein
MHARPEIRDILIGKKMRRWCLVAQHPWFDRTYSPARARRNFWRLCVRYPEIAARLGLTYLSVYEPY